MKIRVLWIATLALGGACGDDSQPITTDAAVDRAIVDAPPPDARIDAAADASSLPDAVPGGCGMRDGGTPTGAHKLYLVFDGVTLTAGNCDDSRTNCTSLATSNTTVPAFEATRTNRQPFLDAIVAAVQGQLAPYDVEVVTTRPASGDYDMIVFANCVSSLSCQTGVIGIAQQTCAGPSRDSIALVFDQGTSLTAANYAQVAIFDLGSIAGLSANMVAGDCMNMNGSNLPCTWGTDVPTVASSCLAGAHENEDALMEAAFGCR